MIGKIVLLAILLVFVGACTAQEYPPYPEDALALDSDWDIVFVDEYTGDVTVRYTLIICNITEEVLETVIVKDFEFPNDIIADLGTFEMENLWPGEKRMITFDVIIEGWGLSPREDIWEFYFTIRLEEGNFYTEQCNYREIHLYPPEESSGSQIALVTLAVVALIVIAILVLRRSKKSEQTEKSAGITYTAIVLQAMKNIKSEVLFFGVITAGFLIGLAFFGLEVVRELKWAFIVVLIVCLVFYFLMKREENIQKRRETA